MPYRPGRALLLSTLLGLLVAPASIDDEPSAVVENLAGMRLLRGPWDSGTIHRESVLFLKGADGVASVRLLYDADRVLAVGTADGARTFEEGRDYEVSRDRTSLILPPDSGIPLLNAADLFRPKGSPRSLGHKAGDPETSVLFDNEHFFHDLQVEVTYVPRDPKWDAPRPSLATERLARTIEKLAKKQPVTIALSGDSISEGYNASSFTKAPPRQPAYPRLVAAQLEASTGSKVTLHNFAVAGWSSRQGVDHLDTLLKCKPDLVIIAYGMNDVGGRDPKTFRSNIETMLKRIREADSSTDVILVSTMTGNPDWMATPAEMFPAYREALASLEGPGVALADVTSIWRKMMERKRHIDVTGNGVNHPNDYGHRVYAQAILALLVPNTAER